MKNNFYELLINELKKEDSFVSEGGTLLKNKIYESALKLDDKLISLLFNNETIRERLFKKLNNNYIFDKVEFGWILNNKEFLPSSYTKYKNKIGLISGNEYLMNSDDVTLAFPYKDCLLEGGQTKEEKDRREVFYNFTLNKDEIDTLLAPKVFTNVKKFENGNEIENISSYNDESMIIKGNNLITSASLLNRFEGKVDFIYLDPPYNTYGQADIFSYNNSFKHSTWLTFMKNRLENCKRLLKNTGFVALTIDQFELFYLGVLCDEVFDRDNRVGIVTVVHKPEGRNQEKFFATSNEFMLVYAKNKALANFNNVVLSDEKRSEYTLKDNKGSYKLNNYLRSGGGDVNLRINKPHFWYPIYVNRDTLDISLEEKNGYEAVYPITNSGIERTWKTKMDTFATALNNNEIVATIEDGKIVINEKYRNGELIKTHWIDKRYNAINNGTKVLQDLNIDGFSYPKSVYAVQDIISICCPDDGLVLDLFAGSGTTAHAVMNLNKLDDGTRRFIICEQMEYVDNVTYSRVKKVASALEYDKPIIYCELKEINEKYVSKINNCSTTEELEKLIDEIKDNALLNKEVNLELIINTIDEFRNLELNEQKDVLLMLLDKNMLYLNYSEIDDETYGISECDKEFNNSFYGGNYE